MLYYNTTNLIKVVNILSIDFEYIREHIYPKYDEEYLMKILLHFYRQQLNVSTFDIENRNVNKILSHFFEDLIYAAKSKNGKYSPNQVINDDELLKRAFEYIEHHRAFYHNNSDITNLKDFFFSSSMVGKITNFNPVIARKIYEYYVPHKNATIFDYSCGYGSRMLGALSSQYDYHYIGVDPYTELYERLLIFSNWIKNTLKNDSKVTLLNVCSEEFIPSFAEKMDLSFSSPPYFNYEIYVDCSTQSYIRYPTYEEWKKNYVSTTLMNIYSYTKQNGLHIVNLQDTKNIKLISDWIYIAQDIGFKIEEIRTIETLKRHSSKNENKLFVMRK